jgi:hypothetical protein
MIETLLPIVKVAFYLAAGYCGLVGWFFCYAYARILKDRGVDFHKGWVVYPVYVFLTSGAILDIAFNAIYGTLVFRELPREVFFTSRIKRWSKEAERASPWPKWKRSRYETALDWKTRINKIEPGHI